MDFRTQQLSRVLVKHMCLKFVNVQKKTTSVI